MMEMYKQEGLQALETEYPKYFEALNKHPRLLVGTEVPSLRGEGTETLRDSGDAKEWQEAVRSILQDDLKRRVAARSDESQGFLRTVHSSIELFQNNSDLVPGTKQFDRELADEFIKLAKPYEVRNGDDKLIGFQIPVQPLIDSVRQRLAATRTAPPPAPPAPPVPEETHQPQAGIPAKAGNSGEGAEDFSALFSTLGLGGLRF